MSSERRGAETVIAKHRLTGDTVFSHQSGCSMVSWPTCGCGEQMPPWEHPEHLLNALADAGYHLT